MRDGALPAVLLCLALGLLLAYVPARGRAAATAALIVVAVPIGGLALPVGWQTPLLLSCWGTTGLFVAGVYLSRAVPVAVAVASGLIGGVLAGAVTSEVGRVEVLAAALPCVLVAWPGSWLASRRWSIVLKILASWLLAVAVLSAGVALASGGANAGADHLD